MNVVEKLDELRKSVPGCSVVVLGDLSAELVLCASASTRVPQERLDGLCAQAKGLLAGRFGRSAGAFLNREDNRKPDMAAVLTRLDVQVFVRSPVDDADVLCCVCPRNVDITEVADRARSALAELSAPH